MSTFHGATESFHEGFNPAFLGLFAMEMASLFLARTALGMKILTISSAHTAPSTLHAFGSTESELASGPSLGTVQPLGLFWTASGASPASGPPLVLRISLAEMRTPARAAPSTVTIATRNDSPSPTPGVSCQEPE